MRALFTSLILISFSVHAEFNTNIDPDIMVPDSANPQFTQEGPIIPSDLGKTCMQREDDAKGVKAAYQGAPSALSTDSGNIPEEERAPSECYKKIIKNYNECGTTPANNGMAGATGDASITKAAKGMINNEGIGVEQNTAKAADCKKLKDDAIDNCHSLRKNIVQSINDNDKQDREEQADASLPASQKQELHQRHQQISKQLQAQMRNTDRLSDAASKALDNYSQCYTDEAQRDQIIKDYSEAQMTSASGDAKPQNFMGESGGEAKSKAGEVLEKTADFGKDQAQDQLKDQVKDYVKENLQGSAESEIATAAEGAAIEGAATTGAETVATTTTKSFGEKAVTTLLGTNPLPTLGAVGLGAVTNYFGSTVPAGTCSDIYSTPFSSNVSGCARSQDAAISALANNK